jgi:hypothetical protein
MSKCNQLELLVTYEYKLDWHWYKTCQNMKNCQKFKLPKKSSHIQLITEREIVWPILPEVSAGTI